MNEASISPRPQARARHLRLLIAYAAYAVALAIIVGSMMSGYRYQKEQLLEAFTQELRVAYESVTSTAAATPELFHARIARDERVTGIMQRANAAAGAKLDRLHRELLAYLQNEYETLRDLDFRQLHFHLTDNRSFARFHRPERYGDDLTRVRATVRATNETQSRTYGFEEGRIYNGFRYVYPLFHEGEHVGSVEASMNYRAIVSRMRSSRPAVDDFILDREVVEQKVFADERDNYVTACFSHRFVRETSLPRPDTSPLGVSFDCVFEAGSRSTRLVDSLESYRPDAVALSVAGAPIAVSLLPIGNYEGENVAFIIRYSRIDELTGLKTFFISLGIVLALLAGAVLVLYLRITSEHERVVEVGAELRRTNRSKDRFFSIVSHDLRGPMGSLSGLADILRDDLRELEDVPAETSETAEAIADGANNVLNLLSDLLDWSRSQRGDITFRPDLHRWHEIVADQLEPLARTASDKQITLEDHVDTAEVYGDEYMLKAVIRNLVSNAIKFTPEGGSVSVSSEVGPEGITIAVTDTGVGMSEQQQIDAFDVSVKASTIGTGGEHGTGLGLTVCREFVRRHGGTISVESQPGAGTTFSVFLPDAAGSGTG